MIQLSVHCECLTTFWLLCTLYTQIEQKIEDMFASRKRVTEVAKPNMGQGLLPNPVVPNLANLPGMTPQMMPGLLGPIPPLNFGSALPMGPPQAGGKLELARRLAAKIHMQRNLGPEAQVCCLQCSVCVCVCVCVERYRYRWREVCVYVV